MSAYDHFEAPATVHPMSVRFHRDAYGFLLDALHGVISGLSERRHITGQELAEAVRGLAIERFGPLARTVLGYWGIQSTSDLGEMVFDLVEMGILVKDTSDRREDFADVFDFQEVFDDDYPWTVYPWKVAAVCPWTVATTAE
ncbi:MAG: hypothetical protein OXL34_00750 [Gemmatimonadota bacterium]|nr:hypothetical protein [Gemmatimonadota bacterium]